MLRDLTIQNWGSIIFAFSLISGPGWLLIQLHSYFKKFNYLCKLILVYCFSISILSLVFSIARFFQYGISNQVQIIFIIICWVGYFLTGILPLKKLKIRIDFHQITLAIIVLIVITIILYSLRNIVAGLGSDSYHHTLISQIILENGKAPDNYQPYAPLVSFSYHFGFHALSALISNITGITLRLIVPITGIFILGLTSISCYFLSFQIFQNRTISYITGILTICISVSPFYLVNYSRFPQLLGLVFCGTFIGLFIFWLREGYPINFFPFVTLITLGQAFAHYRITLMSIIGILLFILLKFLESKNKKHFLVHTLNKLFLYLISTIVLFSPWIIQVIFSKLNGYSGDIGKMGESFFSLNRLGHEMLNYPSNKPIFAFFVFSIILLLVKKNKYILWLFSWIVLLILFSSNLFFGILMDTVSVIFSLFVPVLIILSWAINEIISNLKSKIPRLKKFSFILILPLIYFIGLIPSHIHPEYSFVAPEDLIAFQWIKDNTIPNSKFVVNTFNFDFNNKYIIGIDAGYWIPLLANRQTITIPMIFIIEQIEYEEDITNLVEVHNIDDFSTTDNVKILNQLGFTHIYIGQYGSKEKLNQFENSEFYKQIYNISDTYIFEIEKLNNHK